MEQKNKVKEQIIAYLMLIAGSFLFAVGDVMFVNPYLLAPGGTYGLSNVLNTVWPQNHGRLGAFLRECDSVPGVRQQIVAYCAVNRGGD